MLGQPIIENSIEHGIRNLKKQGHISVHYTLQGENIGFEVMDNGNGFVEKSELQKKEDKHSSMALLIIKERIQMYLSKKESKITVDRYLDPQRKEEMTKVSFVLPHNG